MLSAYGYSFHWTQGIADTLSFLQNASVDLMILDVQLQNESGYTLCRKIRETWDFPILFLTGCSSETELIQGFHAGGDDYLTKPFRVTELLLRIEALLKRSIRQNGTHLTSGDLTLDSTRHQMKKGDKELELTAIEQKLVWYLMNSYPAVLPREELFYQIWDKHNFFVEANTLNVNISRLRDKLGFFGEKRYIETVRGVGYRWAIPVRR